MPRSWKARLSCLCLASFFLVSCPETLSAQTRDEKVRNDRASVLDGGYWVYNDLAEGRDLARRQGKPLMVVLRCIP